MDSKRGLVGAYYYLTKPGIIYGNIITAAAGFFLASRGDVQLGLLVAILVGTSLMIASACVFNNYLDRGIDAKMARTKHRALVTGSISGRNAIIFATVLASLGIIVLGRFTNLLTLGVGVLAYIDYVVIYGFTKRRFVYGTHIGSISGAASIVAGYTAVTNRLDLGALLLFLVLAIWQMPHFFAIAVYRRRDYAAAGLPVLPVVRGVAAAKRQIIAYITAFVVATALLTSFHYAGYVYLVVMLGVGVAWLVLAVRGMSATDDTQWARRVFRFSLIVLTTFSIMISITTYLP